jgi:hypothetical protein
VPLTLLILVELATFDLGATGEPLDISATPTAFVVLLTEGTNKLYVQGYTCTGSLVFTTIIMDNGPGSPPSSRLSGQIILFVE